ncbi:WD40 repeat-like protein [Ascodesmis nigricans]|uniref:Pre-rRNA-processing protein IPI3 n=1 Tax=Ascodesmis nigricans TaxID=341454 RepID=A0A4S2N2J5_9PEZI|nr:WD40 repeat-like protein [Ascodesmis nigricans]
MLHEHLLLAATHHLTDSADVPSLSFHDLHTATPLGSFKRSNTRCVALTKSHLFAAQTDKAVVNVYALGDGKKDGKGAGIAGTGVTGQLETTVSFPEKVSALAASRGGEFVAVGTEGGRVYVWEVASGRFTTTPLPHLQSITTLSFSPDTTHLYTGSSDTTIQVHSLLSLLSPGATPTKPLQVLTRHRLEITALLPTHTSHLLFTSSLDSSIILWSPLTGQPLRTFLLPSPAHTLTLDPTDRALYCGTPTGIITLDLHHPLTSSSTPYTQPHSPDSDIPVTIPAEQLWVHTSPITALSISAEGNLLIAGTQEGKVGVWDVATGRLFRQIADMKAPVKDVVGMPPREMAGEVEARTECPVIVKPMFEAVLSAAGGREVAQGYVVKVRLVGGVEGLGEEEWGSSFEVQRDLEVVENGARRMRRLGEDVEGRRKVEKLERELESVYEAYERLSSVQKRTWEALVEKVGEGMGK